MTMKPQHETGDFMLDAFDICGYHDFPYGICIDTMSDSIESDLMDCIGVVRAAIKKAKTGIKR